MDWKTPISRPGIPYNSSDNSELYNWIREARKADLALSGKALRIVIKADKDAKYSVVKQVIKTLEKQKLRRFSLMTGTSEHVI
jgi:biopolymer transport protein ExbD